MANAQVKDMLSPNEIFTFCTQISMILKSGISVSEGVSIMIEDLGNSQGREILESVSEILEEGGSLSSALEASGKFPKYMVDMTEIGEATGRLDDVMDSLCIYYEREQSLRKSIRSAVTYPMIMILMMVIVILVLVVKVMPIFNQVFESLGTQMTGFSKSILDFGGALSQYSLVIVGVLVVLAAAFLIFRATAGGRAMLERWKGSFPGTRKLHQKIATGRFASALSMMLSSGLDTDQSLDMVEKLLDNNETIKKKIGMCREAIKGDATFAEALVTSGVFSGMYARMVAVAFKAGAVDTVMEKIAHRYEDEIDDQVAHIISILEPTLVAILSIIVGMILLSVMLPLMGIMTSIG